ncbi:uncharacterized protein PSFLO_04698 [Pseudozyma flocculosa]|uniref:Uncharacterized protein n=1 Tax=Pseudozyma flocculosa TaxID=84751 RepID=A0A5C3F446_9BASI|nr:uncharacterized protein PSFLO_04698 [Pseudozyma flocculosa]
MNIKLLFSITILSLCLHHSFAAPTGTGKDLREVEVGPFDRVDESHSLLELENELRRDDDEEAESAAKHGRDEAGKEIHRHLDVDGSTKDEDEGQLRPAKGPTGDLSAFEANALLEFAPHQLRKRVLTGDMLTELHNILDSSLRHINSGTFNEAHVQALQEGRWLLRNHATLTNAERDERLEGVRQLLAILDRQSGSGQATTRQAGSGSRRGSRRGRRD